ncbi:caffeic acid 3-O-methyltransferase isoform X1 [Panicum hallii]|uniref:caffeic acid 3-O-methyltransferase isoform X1 n=1 Tax=Panicum hallii TaxID=206008 RepID=UPI000DF4DD79|nr:caffeic acid 3-O-methyltransferase isoform X1 [Panicum hallii]
MSPPPPPAEARLAMMELANMISVPMALTAIIRLGVPSAVWAGGANAPLSAAELLPEGHPDPSVLERLLRLLASRGVFSEHGASPRRFALTAVGRTLVPGPSGASYADYVLQHHQDALVAAWPRLHEAVLDPAGPEPFARANAGVPAYAYYGKDREANEVMLRAMTGVSEPFMEALLDGYAGGFDGVATLVDVGGSSGACLEMIMRRVGTITEGINFDLPDVVAAAPPIAGVRHVGGDMFKSIPSGDAIFMKGHPEQLPQRAAGRRQGHRLRAGGAGGDRHQHQDQGPARERHLRHDHLPDAGEGALRGGVPPPRPRRRLHRIPRHLPRPILCDPRVQQVKLIQGFLCLPFLSL